MTNSIASRAKPTLRFCWILGWQNDLLYIFAPTLMAYLLIAWFSYQASMPNLVAFTAAVYAVNVFHQGATYFHFFDKNNRAYYFSKERRMRYVAWPASVLLCSLILGWLCKPLLFGIYIIWGIQHVVQQNMGILLLYHHPNSGEAIVNRDLEVRTQHAGAYFFTSVMFARLFIRDALPAVVVNGAITLFLAYFVFSVGQYLWDLSFQVRKGAELNIPALMFWLVTIFFLFPTALVGGSYELAVVIPGLLHWLQYIGINLVLVNRKYVRSESKGNAANLPIQQPLALFIGFCLLLVIVQFGSIHHGIYVAQQTDFWVPIMLGLGLVHYALDGCIWKFRELHNRQNILPHLVNH